MRRLIAASAAACLSLLFLTGWGQDDTRPPTDVVKVYLRRLADSRAQSGIDECYDVTEMNRRVFGHALASMDPSRRIYLDQLTSVALKTAISALPMDKLLAKAKRTPFTCKIENDEACVSCTMAFEVQRPAHLEVGGAQTTPDTIQHEMRVILHRSARGWKIVDTDQGLTLWKSGFADCSEFGMDPVEFMEGVVGTALNEKYHPGSAARQVRNAERGKQEAQAGYIQTQLDTLANQLELFKARENRYPDLLHTGWTELINGGYLKSSPVNPINGSSRICAGTKGRVDCGWTWDAESGSLGACYYDENSSTLTPDQP